jgi:hypothetical protein
MNQVAILTEARDALIRVLEAEGVDILKTDRLFLLTQLQRFTNATLAAVMNALIANIKGGGLAGLAAPLIRSALANTTPTLQKLADQKEEQALQDLSLYLSYLLQSSSPSSKKGV